MVESINSKVDLVMEGTSYIGLTDYGKIMIGNMRQLKLEGKEDREIGRAHV